jgi:molybdopterin synthase catalytic subunit
VIYTAVTSGPIDADAVLARVGAAEDGAVLLFLGIVRDHNDGRPVSGVGYESYAEMAESVLHEVAAEAAELLTTDRVAVVHRVGELGIGEASVAVAVSSPHRSEAYDASRYIIEEIKKRLPVWKHERYTDGTTEWVAGRDPEPVDRPIGLE